ncbi:MAG: RluA family pseudouridine synthase [Candidatus Eisenbacteria bacterium]|nr:RluA family pseudouridine synthase [Candidatus Eisenbacteria bacterium]
MDTRRRTYRLRTTVHHSLRDRPLIDYLAERFRYLPRALWEERLRNGRIRVNGEVAHGSLIVRRDDEVEYTVTVDEPEVDRSYDAVYEDDELLIVSKSGNIPVHASGQFIGNTLVAVLRAERGDDLTLCHRLDRETSGLIVLTKSPEARRGMSAAFEQGRVRKTYLAIVRGTPTRSSFLVDAPLRRIGRQHPVPRSVVDHRRGRAASTSVEVLERLPGAALLHVEPLTGRTNQIRVHLEVAGHPLLGDKTYGLPAALLRELVREPGSDAVRRHLVLKRHALHAARLRFSHPVTGRALDVAATLPTDLRRALENLRRKKVEIASNPRG